jgi:hypothetical protein
MMQYVDPDFQRKLDEFNASQGGPSYIDVCWDPHRDRWTVFAVPQDYGHHPLSKTWVTPKLMRNFLDGSGRRGVFLFTWRGANGEYMPLDDRLFTALRYADSFSDKRHFEKTIEEPEAKREMELKKERRDIAYAAKEYWWNLANVTSAGNHGNWRRAKGIV